MGDNLQPNSARIGLDLDSTTAQVKQGSVTFALNATVTGFDGNQITYQNEQANEPCDSLPDGYQVICAHAIIEKDIIVYFLVHPAGHSEIGVLDTKSCTYTTKINQDCLNFSINDPVRKAVHKITSCGTEIYWRDNNGRRYLDLDNLPYAENIADCETNASTTEIDCNRLLINPLFSTPTINYQGSDSEGDIVAGSYQFGFQYSNALGDPYTAVYSITAPIPVSDPLKVTEDFNFHVGKSIKLDVTGIDTTGIFDFYNLIAIKTINNITSFDLIGTYQIERDHQTVVYTGQNIPSAKLTADEIFEKFSVYDKADDLTAVQDILIWKGVTPEERISWQKIANQIKLQWETYVIPYTSSGYKDPIIAANQKGYFRDEVYSLEFCPIYKNGSVGDGFHIPGRVAMDTDTTLVNNQDIAESSTLCDEDVKALPRWKVYNTAHKQGNTVHLCTEKNAPSDCVDNCYLGPHEYGEFAYWESLETYPCDEPVWGELAGKNIRHHKFPDASICPHFDNSGNIFPIGIKIDLDQINALIKASTDLTEEQKSKISGFKILRGDRANNKSIVAKGIFYNVGKYIKNDTTYFYPNYPYNDIRPDPFISGASNSPVFTNVLSQEKQISTVGAAETVLDTQPVTGNNLYHGTTFTFGGVFNNDAGIRSIKVMLKVAGSSDPKFLIFDSGPLTVGKGSSWSLNITTAFTKVVKHGLFGSGQDGWEMKFIGNLDAFGTYNKNVYDDIDTEITGGFDTKWEVKLIGTGIVTGDIALTSTDIDQASTETVQIDQLDGFSTDDSRKRFTFHSPDTSFYQPVLGNKMSLDGIIYGSATGHYTEVLHHAKYKFPSLNSYLVALGVGIVVGFASGQYGVADRPYDGVATFTTVQFLNDLIYKLIPRKNFAFQYNSIGNYNNFQVIPNDNGNKIRSIDLASYLIPGYNTTGDTNLINNYQRESSVFLRTNGTFPIPNEFTGIPEDVSRVTLTALNHCDTPTTNFARDISAFYGGIKKANLSQYGQIYSYKTIDTSAQFHIGDTGTRTVFGGDCFINKFAFKRKMPFFLDNRVKDPDDSDVFYDELGNVGFPTYWFSTDIQKGQGGNFNVGTLFGVKVNHFDCNPHKFFYDSGKMYLFAYGIPNFFCESEVNVDFRQATNALEGEFYPHVGTGIPDDWLQEYRVPIEKDNTYVYNKSFSKQSSETVFTHLPVDFVPNENCLLTLPNRAIYSDQQFDVVNYKRNNWRIYRPASYYDFPLNFGKLISIEGTENREVVARFENKSQIYDRLLTMDTSSGKSMYVGNYQLFRSAPPIDYKETDIGFNGTQHKFFLRTEFGNVSVDCKRGNVYLLNGQQAKDITDAMVSQFFTDNLPFQLQKYFPNYNIDNHFKGVGLTGTYETKYKRLVITKLDYKPKLSGITYDGKSFFYKGVQVYLTQPDYFCNVSFSISYSFLTQSWVSFHSYLPNYYVANADYFYSGVNSNGIIWKHNSNIIQYNSFYGEQHPYILEYPFVYKQNDEILQSFADYTKVIQQIDEQSFIEQNNVYFNKFVIYNNQQSSGTRNLIFKKPGAMSQVLKYPKYNSNSIDVLVTKSDNCYNFNDVWDITANQSLPLFVKACQSLSIDKIVNDSNMIYSNRSYKKYPIRAKDSKVRLILDNTTDYRLISQFVIEETQTSIK